MRTCLSLLLVLTAACSANTFIGQDAGDAGPNPNPVGGGDGGAQEDADGGIAPGTDAVYVSSSKGAASNDGSKAHPLASLDAAISAAKAAGLPVHACAETYAEVVQFQNGVAVSGNYDCSAGWTVSTTHAKIAPATSPAATATNITTATRVDSVDIFAPDFTNDSQSSIALVATNASQLTIANAIIHAGTGGRGADGTVGIQLTESGSKNGVDAWADGACTGTLCALLLTQHTGSAAGGTNACVGESGHDPGPGGAGGTAGEYESVFFANSYIWNVQNNEYTTAGFPTTSTSQTAQGGTFGVAGSSGAPGISGKDGLGGNDFGTITANGYTTSDGTAGVDGNPGQGGGGAGGYNQLQLDYPASTHQGYYGWGIAGAGGGAGGCPGLAGKPGTGGGASIAIIAFGAGLALDTVAVESSKGGDAGASGAPSASTSGGSGGHPLTSGPSQAGGNGGAGGNAGVSGNGAGGPSIGIAYNATKVAESASKVTPGAGGSGVAARVVNGQTIPASVDGMSAGVYMFGQ